jgi:tetratricopeptide (TPR) repeat protein/WD40 repeat protein
MAVCSQLTTQVSLSLLDYQTGQVLQTNELPWQGGWNALAWHPDGRRLFIAAGVTNAIQEYRFDSRARPLTLVRSHPTSSLTGSRIFINAKGDRIAYTTWTASMGRSVGILDLETGRTLFQSTPVRFDGDNFRFSADERSLIAIVGFSRGQSSYGVIDLADSREIRTIALSTPGRGRPIIHPGGRLAIIPQGGTLALVDTVAMRELGTLKEGGFNWVSLTFDGTGRLYSNSLGGAFSRPVYVDRNRVTMGYPERLRFYPGSKEIATSTDGRTVAQAWFEGYGVLERAGGWLIAPDRPDNPYHLTRPGTGMDRAAVSPDGRWACFGVHESGNCLVYDIRAAALVWEKGGCGFSARFTPDGRWLVADWGAYRVGDWDNQVVLDASHTGFVHDVSPDSLTALLSTTEGYARLVEIATGRELVRIEAPEGGLGETSFTPDGTRLLEVSNEGLRVWDLRRIRARLAEMGLDWDAPPLPPESEPSAPAPPPLQLTNLGGDLLSDPAKLAAYEHRLTIARLLLNPLDARAHLDLARREMEANHSARALVHLRVATLTRPDSFQVRMNAGLCLMRLSRVAEAIPEFTVAAKAQPEDFRVRYHRAQAYRQIGRHAEAADDLSAVIARFPEDAELYEQRADCYEKLGDKERAAADRAAADRCLPGSVTGMNNRAWRLLTGPPGQRDPVRALELIQKVVKVEPDKDVYLNTLGVALYRNDRLTEAVAAHEKSLAAGKGQSDAFDLYFLAMCHAKLGDAALAKSEFERAVRWVKEHPNLEQQYVSELKAFRAEAKAVLAGPPGEMPDDAFAH